MDSDSMSELEEPIEVDKKTEERASGFWTKKRKVVAAVVAVVVLVALFVEFVAFTVHVDLEGEGEITLTDLASYEEAGATARVTSIFSSDNVIEDTLDVAIDNKVNDRKPGTYWVTYSAHWGIWFGQTQRKVNVVDTAPPVITLVADTKHTTLPGEPYEDAGYSAVDDYDGDVTSKIERVEADGVVTYTVSDSSGNTTTATRTIIYHEEVPPEIALKGNVNMTVAQGGQYFEPGFEAIDNVDGDITSRVVVEGGVDTGIQGTYVLTYIVEDLSGNEARAERIVTVVPAGEKVIYLTFDDGPSGYTSELLDVLAKHGVKATFFVTARGDTSLIAREAAEGHAIGIHSLTHNYNDIYASEGAFFDDLNAMQDIIVAQTGRRATVTRFPGGSSNTVSSFNPGIMTTLAAKVQEAGYQYFDWNVSSGDAGGTTSADEVFDNVVSGVEGRSVSVVLQHDTKGFSVEAVERIIVWGKESGYSFATLDNGSPVCHHPINN